MSKFQAVFGRKKPVIGMIHLGALPGSPLHDAHGGLKQLVEAAFDDLQALQKAGFDAIMFGNENDRPYEFNVDAASTATMAFVIGRLREEITVPFGVNVLWDPQSTIALAACQKKAPEELPPPPTATPAPAPAPSGPTVGSQQHFVDAVGQENTVVYFDTDRFNIDAEDQAKLQ